MWQYYNCISHVVCNIPRTYSFNNWRLYPLKISIHPLPTPCPWKPAICVLSVLVLIIHVYIFLNLYNSCVFYILYFFKILFLRKVYFKFYKNSFYLLSPCNSVPVSPVQQSDSVIHVCNTFFFNSFHHGLSKEIGYSSLYYIVGPDRLLIHSKCNNLCLLTLFSQPIPPQPLLL